MNFIKLNRDLQAQLTVKNALIKFVLKDGFNAKLKQLITKEVNVLIVI